MCLLEVESCDSSETFKERNNIDSSVHCIMFKMQCMLLLIQPSALEGMFILTLNSENTDAVPAINISLKSSQGLSSLPWDRSYMCFLHSFKSRIPNAYNFLLYQKGNSLHVMLHYHSLWSVMLCCWGVHELEQVISQGKFLQSS